MKGPIRIINTMFWCWLALSNALMPVTAEGDYWAERARQFFQLGPVDDIPRLMGHAIVPFVLWLVFDWLIRHVNRKSGQS